MAAILFSLVKLILDILSSTESAMHAPDPRPASNPQLCPYVSCPSRNVASCASGKSSVVQYRRPLTSTHRSPTVHTLTYMRVPSVLPLPSPYTVYLSPISYTFPHTVFPPFLPCAFNRLRVTGWVPAELRPAEYG